MPFTFQYNKTSLNLLGKQLKIRKGALPILKNKESALRVEVIKKKNEIKIIEGKLYQIEGEAQNLFPLIGRFPIQSIYTEKISIEFKKIAGVKIPVFTELKLALKPVLWHEAPHWYPDVFNYLQKVAIVSSQLQVAKNQLFILENERKRTTQKVNLYEKVQIPELEDAMKKIKRFLEDKENLSKAAQKMVKARSLAL